MKTKIFFALFFILATPRVHAQTLERQVIGAAGIFQTAGWGSLSATTGESVINTFSTSSVILTQGFQQPLVSDLNVNAITANNITLSIFPDPAADLINVTINTDVPGKHYSVNMFDLLGQLVKLPFRDLSSGMNTKLIFDLRAITNGTYFIQIVDEHNARVKTLKFIKSN